MIVRAALLACACAGCLGPQVSDEIAPAHGGIVAAGTPVPSADDDAALDGKIAAHDQVAGTVPRLTAFAGGAPVHRWDLGTVPEFAAPTFRLVDANGAPIDHPLIVEAVPGDPGYSPFGSLLDVAVTAQYAGEQLTSATAVQQAIAQGLLAPPVVAKQGLHRPIVAKDVALDVGAGAPLAPAARAYYQGEQVRYFDLGAIALDAAARVPERPRYVLRRDGEEPLSEPVRGVDIDGDGDTLDSNDVLVGRPGDADWSPRCRTVDVVVPAGTASIDTTRDETMAALTRAQQLFDPDAVAGVVIAYTASSELRDCAQQHTPGGL